MDIEVEVRTIDLPQLGQSWRLDPSLGAKRDIWSQGHSSHCPGVERVASLYQDGMIRARLRLPALLQERETLVGEFCQRVGRAK